MLSVTANVVKNVPKQAATNTNSRPQSVVPNRSSVRRSIVNKISSGTALNVIRIVLTTLLVAPLITETAAPRKFVT